MPRKDLGKSAACPPSLRTRTGPSHFSPLTSCSLFPRYGVVLGAGDLGCQDPKTCYAKASKTFARNLTPPAHLICISLCQTSIPEPF